MSVKRFEVHFSATLEVDESVLARGLDPEFKADMYELIDEEGVARHLAWNLAQGRELQSLDGWADMPEAKAMLLVFSCDEAWASKRVNPPAAPRKKKVRKK